MHNSSASSRYDLLRVCEIHFQNDIFRQFIDLGMSAFGLNHQRKDIKSTPFSFPTKLFTNL